MLSVTPITIAVAAAASVPLSVTSIYALWYASCIKRELLGDNSGVIFKNKSWFYYK